MSILFQKKLVTSSLVIAPVKKQKFKKHVHSDCTYIYMYIVYIIMP